MAQEKEARSELLVSQVFEDGIVVETVYDPKSRATRFARQSADRTEYAASIDRDGVRYVPVKARNDLIKHRALLFPSEVVPCGAVEELLGEIETYLARYVVLPPDAQRLAAGYVILSWLYDAFRELPYLRVRGDYGTGKTRALIAIGSITYKPFFASGASTVSPIFHTLNTFKGTLVFDEADFRFSDEKAELVKILNNGNVAGFPVLRTQVTTAKEFEPRAFHVFGPKIVAMRGHYNDRALESRFLSIDMEPALKDSVPINLPDAHEAEALVLRNKLLHFRMRQRLKVRLDDALALPDLEPRTNQILLPLLSVVPEGAYRSAIVRHAQERHIETVSDRGQTIDGHVLSIVATLAGAQPGSVVALGDIATAFRAAYAGEYERAITVRYIGSVLRRLGITPYKSMGVYVIAVSSRLRALYQRFGIGEDTEDPAHTAHNGETGTSGT